MNSTSSNDPTTAQPQPADLECNAPDCNNLAEWIVAATPLNVTSQTSYQISPVADAFNEQYYPSCAEDLSMVIQFTTMMAEEESEGETLYIALVAPYDAGAPLPR